MTIRCGSKALTKPRVAAAKAATASAEDRRRDRVALGLGGEHVGGAELLAALVQQPRQRPAGAVGDGLARPPRDPRARGIGLEVTGMAAAAGGAAEADRDVAELAGEAAGAAEQPPAGDDAAADPGRDGEVDELVAAAAGAEGALGEGGDVGVALDRDRQAEVALQRRRQLQAAVAGAEVGRAEEDAALGVERADGGDADPGQRGERVRRQVGGEVGEQVDHRADQRPRRAVAGGRASRRRRTTSPPLPTAAARRRLAPRSIERARGAGAGSGAAEPACVLRDPC